MKRVVGIVLACVLLSSTLAGCAGAKTENEVAETKAAEVVETVEAAKETIAETAEKVVASYDWPQVGESENPKLVEKDPEEPLKFAFLGYTNNSFWDVVYQGVDQATEFLSQHNVTIDRINLGTDISADIMNNALESCMLQEYDGIICTTLVSGSENYINECEKAGIPVGIIIGEGSPCDRSFAVASDPVYKSDVAAEHILKALEGKPGGKFAVIVAIFSMEATEKQRLNVTEKLEAKGYECVGAYEAHDSADEVYSLTEQILTAHPDIAAIYCVSGGTYGMPKAVEDAGMAGQVYLFGNDEIEENLEYVRKGTWDVVGQDPAGQSFDAFVHLYNQVVGGVQPEKDYQAAAVVVTKDNVDELFPQ